MGNRDGVAEGKVAFCPPVNVITGCSILTKHLNWMAPSPCMSGCIYNGSNESARTGNFLEQSDRNQAPVQQHQTMKLEREKER